MYNRYLTDRIEPDAAPALSQPTPTNHSPTTIGALGDLTRLLGGRIQGFRLDMDMVIVLLIVWFLLSDGGTPDIDQLILVAVLLFLGL